jgi:N-acetyl-gamma-glutamyl-phosphate reductase
MKITLNSAVLLLSATAASAFAPALRSTRLSTFALDAKKKIFIDGEAGTTGIQVRGRIEARDDLEIISAPDELRKDEATRKKLINEADAVILCLPDAASIEASSWVEPDNDRTVLIDASTAFRVNPDWTYGFPELSKEQREKIKKSKRIANPGCYPTGFIGLTRPLVDAGILAEGTPLTVNAISGYSGGGKGLMEVYESGKAEPWGSYGFSLKHKHIPEMAEYSGLHKKPIFQPQVASFPQGMVVSVPLHYAWLKKGTTGKDIHEALKKHYEGSTFVEVMPFGEEAVKAADLLERGAFLRPDTLANTNKMQLFVFANDEEEEALLCARLDNLGKGASGAAVQNLNLALGLDETEGLL